MSLHAAPHPGGANARIEGVDALRGFALLGIFLVNISAFASSFYGKEIWDPAFDAPLDRGARLFVSLLFETKFYLLFSFLFGYSFTLQMESARRSGASHAHRFLRRLAGLWLLGVLHAVFLFHGDILTTYAVLGVLLLAIGAWADGRLLRLATALIALTACAWALLALASAIEAQPLDHAALHREAEAATQAFRQSAATVVAQHLRELSTIWQMLLFVQAPCALSMFMLGLVAGRRRMLERVDELHRLRARLMRLGALVGFPGAAIYAYSAVYRADDAALAAAGFAIGLATAPFLTGAYIAMAVSCFERFPGLRHALAPAGRMALSNYLLQSATCALLFHAYGLGLVGQLSPLQVLLLALLLFILQLALSRWWMQRFAYGWLEWLLRAITLGAWPRWRRASGRTSATTIG